MRVRARCFATLRELSAARSDLDLPDGASVADAWDALVVRHAGLLPHRPFTQPARNGSAVSWDEALA
ncbi:MAG: MoaD/ThiS family protein, partial [Candidatus Limnocylindria bacterium]